MGVRVLVEAVMFYGSIQIIVYWTEAKGYSKLRRARVGDNDVRYVNSV